MIAFMAAMLAIIAIGMIGLAAGGVAPIYTATIASLSMLAGVAAGISLTDASDLVRRILNGDDE